MSCVVLVLIVARFAVLWWFFCVKGVSIGTGLLVATDWCWFFSGGISDVVGKFLVKPVRCLRTIKRGIGIV